MLCHRGPSRTACHSLHSVSRMFNTPFVAPRYIIKFFSVMITTLPVTRFLDQLILHYPPVLVLVFVFISLSSLAVFSRRILSARSFLVFSLIANICTLLYIRHGAATVRSLKPPMHDTSQIDFTCSHLIDGTTYPHVAMLHPPA